MSASRPGEGRGPSVAHVVGLTALVVATPLCELLRRFPEFLWAHHLALPGVAALVAGLVLLPPLPLLLAVFVASRGGATGRRVAGALAIALPALALALQLAVRAEWGGWPVLAGAVVLAGLAGVGYRRRKVGRAVATVLSIVAFVAPAQLLLAARGSGSSTAGVEPVADSGTDASVVFVIFDELPMVTLRADGERWDGRNFPNFARLAATSHAFLNVTSVSSGTLVAVPAILSGSRPGPGSAPTLAQFPRNLFTWLGGDHAIRAVEQATELCPPELNRLPAAPASAVVELRALVSDLWVLWRILSLPSPWSEDLPEVDVAWRDFAASGAPTSTEGPLASRYQELRAAGQAGAHHRGAEFRRLVASIGAGDPPTLHYVHTMLPHGPWLFDPSGRAYAPADRARAAARGRVWSADAPEMVALGYQRHLLQARFADRLLGELLDRLEAADRLDSTLVVVTADHGASFRPGQPPREGRGSAAETLWVPLLVKVPGQTEAVEHRAPMTSIDVLPTVLDLLDVEAPWPLEGASGVAGEPAESELPDAGAAFAWKHSLFGASLDFDPPLRVSPHAGLIGRLASSLPTTDAGGLALRRLEPGAVLEYDPKAAYVPLLVSGTVRRGRGREECCDLAFAVNGRIAAVHRTHAGASPRFVRFQALLPESSLAPGANELTIHRIDDSRSEPRLARLAPG